MSGLPLKLVSAADARAAWGRLIRPNAAALGFRPGKVVMRGWIRETGQVRVGFWFQITMSGFDKHTGGKFIVEFSASDSSRHTGLRQRLWRLLDAQSREEVHRINNEVIASLPGPSDAILHSLSGPIRDANLRNFQPTVSVPPPNSDVWFRYATLLDVERWGEFMRPRLRLAVAECERLLAKLPVNTGSFSGVTVAARPAQPGKD